MIGAFPPPVFGPSVFNQHIRASLERAIGPVLVIDIGPNRLGSRPLDRLQRAARASGGLVRFLSALARRRIGAVYVHLSGDYGQLFEIPFLIAARLAGVSSSIHYHGYGPIRKRRLLNALTISLAGPKSVHIALCEGMAVGLRARYPRARNVRVLGSASLVPARDAQVEATGPLENIAFLGNITIDKGIRRFLDVAEEAHRRGLQVRAIVAGPCNSNAILEEVRTRLVPIGGSYVGPVYGLDKERFWDSAGVLLFPSTWKHEADPVTVHEGLARGVPVIACRVGCLETVIAGGAGAVADSEDFSRVAIELIERWSRDQDSYTLACRSAWSRSRRQWERERRSAAELIAFWASLCR